MLGTVVSGKTELVSSDPPGCRPNPANRWLFALPALALLANCGHAPDFTHTVLTSVSQVRQLAAAQVKTGVGVRITGILTYFDGISSYCFVQDSTGGIRVGLAHGQMPPATGWRVEVAGVASSGGTAPAIVQARVSALGADALPPPVEIATARLRDPRYEYRRVAVRGVVQSVSSARPGIVSLEIRAGRSTVLATVPASTIVVNDDWVDADIRAYGVLDQATESSQGGSDLSLWVSDAGALETIRPSPPPAALPVTPIAAILALDPNRSPAHRLRIRGVPYAPVQGGLAVMDGVSQIEVRLIPVAPDPNASTLEVAGFLSWEHGRPVLDRAVLVDGVEVADRSESPLAGSTLTTAAGVHQLSLRAAKLGYPVHLHAVVTYFDSGNHLLFVQDRSDGIFVELSQKERSSMQAGDEVDVTGVTTADFAPDVAKGRITVVGHPGLPPAKTGRFGSANWGREDCHWIELEGVVQRVAQGRADTLLTLLWGKNSYKAHVLAPAGSLMHLLDADVKLSGVCGALFNTKRQLLGIQMFVPDAQCIRVVRSAPADPYSMAPTAIADLLQFSRARDMGHRVRLQGTVTYSNGSGNTWVRDETGGVMIQDHEPVALAPGDSVDVAGFPAIAGFSPVVRGAKVKRLRPGAPPKPLRITVQDALRGDFDNQLVQIDGRLVDRVRQPAEQVLTIESGQMVFTAHLPGGGPGRPLDPGTRLRLTGICSVEVEQSQDLILPRTFRLILRSPADILVLGRPPWLTAGRVVPILAGATLLMVAALAWVGLLRKRVRTQTFALRAQTVQLQAAHERTRDALRKACEAESLDLDSKRILELIARDEPVGVIVEHLAEAVALHCEGAVCVILLRAPHSPRVCAVPAVPASWTGVLERIDPDSVSCSPEFRGPRQFSDVPEWADLIDSQKNVRFRAFCAAPIVVDGATAGVIAAFFRDEKSLEDAHGAQLDLWCSIAALAMERRRLHDQLSYRAQHDGLTGLPNRALLYERLSSEIERAMHGGRMLGVLYMDLDGFKQVNDTYGHDAGDVVLQETAKRMTDCVRRGDTVARIGGDEFVVLLPLLQRREDAQQVADKLAKALREPIYSNFQRLSVNASVGIAIWPLDGDQPDPLLRFADAQMYGEKRRRWYDPPVRPGGQPEAPPAAPERAEEAPAGSHRS